MPIEQLPQAANESPENGPPAGKRITLSLDEWLRAAKELYGEDQLEWEFVCPACGNVQKGRDFEAAGKMKEYAHFCCLGRYIELAGKKTCNYICCGRLELAPIKIFFGPITSSSFAFSKPLPADILQMETA